MILLGDRLFSSMTLILYFLQDEKLQRKLRREAGAAILSENNLFWCWYLFQVSTSHVQSSLLCKALQQKHGEWPYIFGLTAENTKIQGGQWREQKLKWLAWIPKQNWIQSWDSEHSFVCSPWLWELGCELPLKSKANSKSTSSVSLQHLPAEAPECPQPASQPPAHRKSTISWSCLLQFLLLKEVLGSHKSWAKL